MQHLLWKNKESKLVADCRVFSVYRNLAEAPQSNEIRDFYVLKLSNWANVIPITEEGNVVFVKQYRHGTSQVTLEIPGGIVDAEDLNTKHTAERELFEETGYKSQELIFLGRHNPNPALQDNICDTYLALNAKQIASPAFDKEGYEQIELCLMPLAAVPQLIANNDIAHGVVITAFYYLGLYENKISNSSIS